MNARTQIDRLHSRLAPLGFDRADTEALRRISMTLSRWAELECGTDRGAIERDDKTGVPYWYNANASYLQANDPRCYSRVPDREKGALKRLQAIMARHPGVWAYHQADPRGCALYVGTRADLAGLSVDACYNRGVAVMGAV
jgi:hypothetical protein